MSVSESSDRAPAEAPQEDAGIIINGGMPEAPQEDAGIVVVGGKVESDPGDEGPSVLFDQHASEGELLQTDLVSPDLGPNELEDGDTDGIIVC